VDVRILGPFEVRNRDRALDLGGPRPRSLLAALVVSAGEVVSADRLIDDLWGESPPRSAGHLVHVYVSSLRKALAVDGAATRLRTRPPGYVLELGRDELDAWRFEDGAEEARRLFASGDPGGALAALDQALALWRGPPLASFTYDPFAQASIARLEELHASAREDRLEAKLALGRHQEAIAELESLLREFPFRERLRAHLMLALYRAGRQADALAVYRETRAALVGELGIEPSNDLRALEQAILRQDPALELHEPSPSRASISGRKLVAVLAATAGDLDPEASGRTLAFLRATLEDVVRAHGGSLEPSPIGDAVAFFGIPFAHEDDAVRAVRAGEAVRARLSSADGDRDLGAHVRIAVDIGEVIVEEDGTVNGDVVPRTLALCRAGRPGQIVIGAAADRLRTAREHRAPDPSDHVPLVGRWTELRRLVASVEGALHDATPALVVLTGDAGVGKSRLAAELLRAVDAGIDVGVGRCVAYGEAGTLGPGVDALSEALGGDLGEVARAVLGGEEGGDHLAELIASASGRGALPATHDDTFVAFRRLVAVVCAAKPVLLLIEDVHWADDLFLVFVEHVLGGIRDAPLAVVCTARPDVVERRPGWLRSTAHAEWVDLAPLSLAESSILLENLTPGEALPAGFRAELLEAAEGNPLFLEQLLAMLRDPLASPADRALPPTIRAVLAARLDALGPGERAVAERAAIVGRDFDVDAVASLLPEAARSSVRRHLETLSRRRFVEQTPGRRYALRFHHALTHEAVYRATPKRLRAALHSQHADHLLARGPREDVEASVGDHFERAHALLVELDEPHSQTAALARRAHDHLAAAGIRALHRGDVAAARRLLERSLKLVGDPDPELLSKLAEAHSIAGASSHARDLRVRALSSARKRKNHRLALHLEIAEAEAAFGETGDPSAERDVVERLIPVAQGLGDDRALANAWAVVGRVALAGGRHRDAATALERALEHAERSGDPLIRDHVGVWLVNELSDGPTPAADVLHRASELRRTLGPIGAAQLGPATACALTMLGRAAESRALFERTDKAYAELGIVTVVLPTLVGEAALIRGDVEEAETALAAAAALLVDRDQATPWVRERQARALREAGKLDEAERALVLAEERVSEREGELVARTRATRALVLLDRADRAAAVAAALDAERLSEPLDRPPLESPRYRGEILLSIAEVLAADGRRAEARSRAIAAAEQFERKGNVVSAERARGLARSLGT